MDYEDGLIRVIEAFRGTVFDVYKWVYNTARAHRYCYPCGSCLFEGTKPVKWWKSVKWACTFGVLEMCVRVCVLGGEGGWVSGSGDALRHLCLPHRPFLKHARIHARPFRIYRIRGSFQALRAPMPMHAPHRATRLPHMQVHPRTQRRFSSHCTHAHIRGS